MHKDFHYKNIMTAYKQGRKSYMGFGLSTQSSGTMTQQESYKHDYAKRIAERCTVLTSRVSLKDMLEAMPDELSERIASQTKLELDSKRSVLEVIMSFQVWDDTTEGHEYWSDLGSRMLADFASELTPNDLEPIWRQCFTMFDSFMDRGSAIIAEEIGGDDQESSDTGCVEKKFNTREELVQDTINYFWMRPERLAYASGLCSYSAVNNPRTSSEGCAIGRLISSELAAELDDGREGGVSSYHVFDKLPEWLKSMGQDFLTDMQDMHDCRHFSNGHLESVKARLAPYIDVSKITFPEVQTSEPCK